MLPIGGMFTALFVLYRWGVPEFLDDLHRGMIGEKLDSRIVTVLLIISALVVGFILMNEIIAKLTGITIVG